MQQAAKWKWIIDNLWQTIVVLLVDELKAASLDDLHRGDVSEMIGHNLMQAMYTTLGNEQVSPLCTFSLASYIASEGKHSFWALRLMICLLSLPSLLECIVFGRLAVICHVFAAVSCVYDATTRENASLFLPSIAYHCDIHVTRLSDMRRHDWLWLAHYASWSITGLANEV